MIRRVRCALSPWFAVKLPTRVVFLVLFLVVVVPGGIPLTAFLAVAWLPQFRAKAAAARGGVGRLEGAPVEMAAGGAMG